MFTVFSNFLSNSFSEVDYKTFYRDIFPLGFLQYKGVYNDFKYNGIIVEVTNDTLDNGKPKVLRHTLNDDLLNLDDVVSRDNFCLMSPISYAGKTRDSSMARDLYALTFDIDGLRTEVVEDFIHPNGLGNMLYQMLYMKFLPIPTYIVCSGTGIHLYYVFKEPIPLFSNILDQLEILKRELTMFFWHDSITNLYDKIQYEPVCQGFRIVGTITKKGDRVKAFKVGDKVDIEYLNSFVDSKYQVKSFTYKSKLTKKEAEIKYPTWYKERIIDGKPKNTWVFNRRVYDSWINKIKQKASMGHRYWCIWILAVTAIKCDISQEELEKDAFELIDILNTRTKTDSNYTEFTEDDVLAALEGYDSTWFTYPVEKMAYRSNIPIIKNKRNFRKQEQHIQIMNSIREIEYPNGIWRKGNGRKDKKDIIKQWRVNNPNGKKVDCIKELKLTKPTVYKWWNV